MQSGLDGSSGAVTSHRVCRVCAHVKPIEEFRTIKGEKKTYRRFQCRQCENLMAKTVREKHALNWEYVSRRREAQKHYRDRNIEKRREYQKEYQRKYRALKKAKAHGKHVDG